MSAPGSWRWLVRKATMLEAFTLNSFFFKILFIYLTERDHSRREEGKRSQKEEGKQAPCWAESPMWDSIPGPWDHDLSRRQRLNPLSLPGAPFTLNSQPQIQVCFSDRQNLHSSREIFWLFHIFFPPTLSQGFSTLATLLNHLEDFKTQECPPPKDLI